MSLRKHTIAMGAAARWLSLIAIALLSLIATVLPYHHHDGDMVCFLWTEKHSELHCHSSGSDTCHHNPFDTDDECGLHTTQFYAESLNDQQSSSVVFNLIAYPPAIYGDMPAQCALSSYSECELSRIDCPDDIPLPCIINGKAIVRRGPPHLA